MGGLLGGGGQRVCWPPSQIIGGRGEDAPTLPTPTHRLVMMIICARLFSNLTMHNKVMDRTRTGFTEVCAQSLSADCDLDL